jgi:hypothetical protein
MRMYEIANAEDQLGLLRIIMNNTWSAISQQASAQAKQKAAEASKPKAKAPKAPTPKAVKLPQRPMPSPIPQQARPAPPTATKPAPQYKTIAPSKLKAQPTITTRSPEEQRMFQAYLRGETPKPL